MPIANRNLDATQQRELYTEPFALLTTGVTAPVFTVPYASVCDAAQFLASGLSGAPTVALNVLRFNVGLGLTTIPLVAAQAIPAFGTSGALAAGLSLAVGASQVALQTNDMIVLQTGGTNAASLSSIVSLVIRPTGDFRHYFGVV